MTARWMQAKLAKRARERRAWARPYSIKSSAGPNWHNGKIMRDEPLDIGEEISDRNRRRVLDAHGRDTSRVPDISEIRAMIPDVVFYPTTCDTPYHRCRIFYSPKTRSQFIIQYVIWDQHIAKISFAYPTFQAAWQKFLTDHVRWRKTISF